MEMYRLAAVLGFAAPALAQGPPASALSNVVLCDENAGCSHEYINGLKYKILTADQAVITVALTTEKKFARINVSLLNKSSMPIDVLPSAFSIVEANPKPKTFASIPPSKVVKADAHKAGWANALNALGAGMARQQSTTQTNSSGTVSASSSDGTYANGTYSGSSTSTTSTPDYAAQAQARENIRKRREAIANERQAREQTSLRANTVQPNQSASGFVYFDWDRKAEQVTVTLPVNGIVYQIPFTMQKQ